MKKLTAFAIAAVLTLSTAAFAQDKMQDAPKKTTAMKSDKMMHDKMSDGKMQDHKMSDGKMKNHKMSDGKMKNGKMSDGKMSDGKMKPNQ